MLWNLVALTIAGPLQCAPFPLMDAAILDQYGERLAAIAKVDNDLAVAFYKGPSSWTMMIVTPGGDACIVSAGGVKQEGTPM